MSDVKVEEGDAPVEGVLLEVEPVSADAEEIRVELRPVEAWQTAHAVPEWLHKGACVAQRWALGREVTEDEYRAAVAEFGGRPVERE
jgi:hypothetical protein